MVLGRQADRGRAAHRRKLMAACALFAISAAFLIWQLLGAGESESPQARAYRGPGPVQRAHNWMARQPSLPAVVRRRAPAPTRQQWVAVRSHMATFLGSSPKPDTLASFLASLSAEQIALLAKGARLTRHHMTPEQQKATAGMPSPLRNAVGRDMFGIGRVRLEYVEANPNGEGLVTFGYVALRNGQHFSTTDQIARLQGKQG